VQVSTIVVLTRRTSATLTQFGAENNDCGKTATTSRRSADVAVAGSSYAAAMDVNTLITFALLGVAVGGVALIALILKYFAPPSVA
jgi:hypothetical protein